MAPSALLAVQVAEVPGPWVQDTGSWDQDPRSRIPDAGSSNQSPGPKSDLEKTQVSDGWLLSYAAMDWGKYYAKQF